MEDFRNIELQNNLTLEPRLQEYWKKMQYFKQNNIVPSMNLEKEFSITNEDKMKLKYFLTGRRDIYSPQNQDYFTEPSNTGFQIKYEDYKKDPRYERLQKKLQRERDAVDNKYSYSKSPELNGFTQNNKSINYLTDEQYAKQEVKKHFLDDIPPYNSDYALNVRKNSQRVYDSYQPKIQYKQYLPYKQTEDSRELPHEHNLDSLINQLDKYREHTNTIYQYSGDMDNLNKFSNQYNQKYQAVPLRTHNTNLVGGTRDIDSQNCTTRGLPERNAKAKSLGYPNYADHSFQFISDDIQDANHVVLPFPRGGDASRLENNYKRAKPYKREIY